MGERLARRGLPLRAPRPEVVAPRSRCPGGDRLERRRALPLLQQFRPGGGRGRGVVDEDGAHGAGGEPYRLPERAVVDPARHGQAARVARHVGALRSVEPATGAGGPLRKQPGAAHVARREDDRAGRAVRVHGERARLHEHTELKPVPVCLVSVGRQGCPGERDGQLGTAARARENEHEHMPSVGKRRASSQPRAQRASGFPGTRRDGADHRAGRQGARQHRARPRLAASARSVSARLSAPPHRASRCRRPSRTSAIRRRGS